MLEHRKCNGKLKHRRVWRMRDVGLGEGTSSRLGRVVSTGLFESWDLIRDLTKDRGSIKWLSVRRYIHTPGASLRQEWVVLVCLKYNKEAGETGTGHQGRSNEKGLRGQWAGKVTQVSVHPENFSSIAGKMGDILGLWPLWLLPGEGTLSRVEGRSWDIQGGGQCSKPRDIWWWLSDQWPDSGITFKMEKKRLSWRVECNRKKENTVFFGVGRPQGIERQNWKSWNVEDPGQNKFKRGDGWEVHRGTCWFETSVQVQTGILSAYPDVKSGGLHRSLGGRHNSGDVDTYLRRDDEVEQGSYGQTAKEQQRRAGTNTHISSSSVLPVNLINTGTLV